MGIDAALVRPIDGTLMIGLEQIAVEIGGEEGRALIPHIIGPVDLIEMIAGIPNLGKQGLTAAQIGVEHILYKFGFFEHGDEHRFRAHHPGVRHIEAEPEVC